ncbi:MAG: hypothetical protein AAFX92_12150 [Pseudomonadota bacterium]
MVNTSSTPEDAWQAFRRKEFAKATAICNANLAKDQSLFAKLPIAEIWTLRAYHQARSGSRDEAYQLLRRLLGFFPEDRIAQQMLLVVEDEIADAKGHVGPSLGHTGSGRLVLGIGTGRSGSTTLSTLLTAQTSARVTHEFPPILRWDRPTNADTFHFQRFDLLLQRHALAGDVAHWWLPKVPKVIERFPSARIIALTRDKRETVESFLKIKGGESKNAINHWVEHDGTHWKRNHWDVTYPKYKSKSLKECIELYWDDYTQSIHDLAKTYPEHVKGFATEALSDKDAQHDILSFVGVDRRDRVIMPGLHKNRATVADGAKMP